MQFWLPRSCRISQIFGCLILHIDQQALHLWISYLCLGLKGLISETKKKEIQERQSTLEIEKAKEAKLKAHRPEALEVCATTGVQNVKQKD